MGELSFEKLREVNVRRSEQVFHDIIEKLEVALRRIENEMAHPSENPNRARRVALSFARRALSGDGPAGGEIDRTRNLRIADEYERALAGKGPK